MTHPHQPQQASASHAAEVASLLRHDLITPINHILGFCDLLIDDAEDKGRISRAQGLRSIRAYGKQALAAIDRAVAGAIATGHPADLVALAGALLGPSAAIAEACAALAEIARAAPDRIEFLEDLDKIRDAAARLVAMSGQMVEALPAGVGLMP